ncbi:MAG TPA: hemerythrin domain-containing protein [Methylomirabilota bacterium]|jgi:iron-sulfur cluster repair protein YtfE (RIC family)
MDAIQFLKQEHQKAKAAFAKLLEAPPAQRGALWKELQPELKAHEAIEEACLYGPIEEEQPSDPRLSEWVTDLHEEEVGEVEGMIKQTEQLDPAGDAWLGTVRQIHSALENHIKQEEGEIFPRIGQVWDAGRLAKAGQEMSEMHHEKAGRR